MLPETATRCFVRSWCPAWRTSPARSAWWCAARGGSCWNRMRKTLTRNAASRSVRGHPAAQLENQRHFSLIFFFFFTFQRKKEYEIEMNRFLSVSLNFLVSYLLTFSLLYHFRKYFCRCCRRYRRRSSSGCWERRSWASRRAAEPVVPPPKSKTQKQRFVWECSTFVLLTR